MTATISLRDKLANLARHPGVYLSTIANRLLAPLYGAAGSSHFIGISGNRSDSDDGEYVVAVEQAVRKHRAFKVFKRDPRYRRVLGHASREHGAVYLEIVKNQLPEKLSPVDLVVVNDIV